MESPLVRLLAAIDQLDADAVIAICTPGCRFSTVDGRHAEGLDGVRQLLQEFLSQLRSTAHEITSQWQQGDVWIAEVLADYELRDWLRMKGLPRVFVVRADPDGIHEVRVYGANERRLSEHETGDEPVRMGGRLVFPL